MFRRIRKILDYWYNLMFNKENMQKITFLANQHFQYNEIIITESGRMRYLKNNWFVLITDIKYDN